MSKFIRLASGQHLNLECVEMAWVESESGYNGKHTLKVTAEHQTHVVMTFAKKEAAEATLLALFPPINLKLPG